MVKNSFKITRIAALVSINGYRQLQLKYDAKGRVLENENAILAYKGHQWLVYSRGPLALIPVNGEKKQIRGKI